MLPSGTPLLQESGITLEGIYRQFQQLEGKKVLVDVKRLAKHTDKEYFNKSTEFPTVEIKGPAIEVTMRLLTDLKFSKGGKNKDGQNKVTLEHVLTYEIGRSELGDFFSSSDLTSTNGSMERKCAWTCLALVQAPQPSASGTPDQLANAKDEADRVRRLKAAVKRLAPLHEEMDLFLFVPRHRTVKADTGSFHPNGVYVHDSRIILSDFYLGGGFVASRSEKRLLGWIGGISSSGHLDGAETILKIQ